MPTPTACCRTTAQATGTECCPVKIYKKFVRHRPLEMNKPDSPLYLAVKHQRKPDDDLWYMRCPLGKDEIGKFLSTAAKNASLQGRVTNHFVRKTCISRLLDANVSNFSNAEKSVLSKGLNFVPISKKSDEFTTRQDVEKFLRRVQLKAFFDNKEDKSDNTEKDAFQTLTAKKSKWIPPEDNSHQ